MSSPIDPTGYIHLLCGIYSASGSFAREELAAMRARDPRQMVRCPECQVATESRSFLPTYKTEAVPPPPNMRATKGNG